ncbi:MAG: hypothetical protein K8R58_12575 [Bacteroidales bacterium]|nr:hypothetical protein [Bacteroidales bacterium]
MISSTLPDYGQTGKWMLKNLENKHGTDKNSMRIGGLDPICQQCTII